jgi:hypothetical protein
MNFEQRTTNNKLVQSVGSILAVSVIAQSRGSQACTVQRGLSRSGKDRVRAVETEGGPGGPAGRRNIED